MSHGLEKVHLVFMWNREYSDNDPRVRREPMKLLQRTEEEMQVTVRKLLKIFLTNFFQRSTL